VSCTETAESIELPFGLWRAHRRHLENTIEPSVCGGDAVLRQITLNTCYVLRCKKITKLDKSEYSRPFILIYVSLHEYSVPTNRMYFFHAYKTRHRASTSMYSLTFRVRVMLP